jgi:hypothetical protein
METDFAIFKTIQMYVDLNVAFVKTDVLQMTSGLKAQLPEIVLCQSNVQAFSEPESSWVYVPSVLFLSFLLMSTLFLLRNDNRQVRNYFHRSLWLRFLFRSVFNLSACEDM